MYSPTSQLKMYPMEINCNLCYNRPTISAHDSDEIPQGIFSSCLKYLSLDIVQTVSWTDIFQKDRIFCHRCNEHMKQLYKLNIQMEQIKNDIDELARQINNEVLTERRICQYNKHQYQNPIYIPEIYLSSDTRDQSTLLYEPVQLQDVLSKDSDIQSPNILIQNCWSIDDSAIGNINITNTEAQKNIMEPQANASGEVHILERNNDVNGFMSTSNSGTFTGGAILAKHIGEKSFYGCEICGLSFRGIGVLKLHQSQNHEVNKSFKCEICGLTFGFKPNYIEHLKAHSTVTKDANYYECETCSEKLSDTSGFIEHMKTHYQPKSYACKICRQRFAEIEILEYHEKDHFVDNKFKCHVCSSTFNTMKYLVQHLKSHPKEKENYACDECGKSYTAEKNLRKHELTHYKSKSVQCTQCDKQFYTIDGLKRHVSTIHLNSEASPAKKCEVCGISCIDWENHKQHMKTHHSMKCDKCEESFDNPNSWVLHTKTKLCTTETFQCEQCPKTFNTVKKFALHQKHHLQRSRSGCQVCAQSFSKNNHLTKHQVTVHHVTAGSSVSCEQCQGIFHNVGSYHWHKVNANNPIVCKVCSKSNAKTFKCWCDCYAHIKAVHNRDENHPHLCKYCRIIVPPRFTKTHGTICSLYQKSAPNMGPQTELPISLTLKRTFAGQISEPPCKRKSIITSTKRPFLPGQEKLLEKESFDGKSNENEIYIQNENNMSAGQLETLEMNEEIEYPVEKFVNVETKIEIKEGLRGMI